MPEAVKIITEKFSGFRENPESIFIDGGIRRPLFEHGACSVWVYTTNKVCVAYDRTTGKSYFGRNREYLQMGVKDSTIDSLWPTDSLNNFRVGNCAENAAIYKALQAGAEVENLTVCTAWNGS